MTILSDTERPMSDSVPPAEDTLPSSIAPLMEPEVELAVPIEALAPRAVAPTLPPCRIPFPNVEPGSTKREMTEEQKLYANRVTDFIVQNVGIHWDTARPFVFSRPWMTDPSLNVLGILEGLVAIGIRHDRLFRALAHDGFFALGYDELEHIFSEFRRHPDYPLPDDVRDLAIPRGIFLKRLRELMVIRPSHPHFKKALFATTEQDFHEILQF